MSDGESSDGSEMPEVPSIATHESSVDAGEEVTVDVPSDITADSKDTEISPDTPFHARQRSARDLVRAGSAVFDKAEADGGESTMVAEDEEENPNDVWPKHHKHMLMITYAGKPIFSRYGAENSQLSLAGVVQAIISTSIDNGDTIRSITVGKHRFVFELVGPVYLVAIASTGEPELHLRRQLRHLYGCVTFILTEKAFEALERQPGYDMRHLLQDTRGAMCGLIARANRSLSIMTEAIPVLRLPSAMRAVITSCLQAPRIDAILYGLLLIQHNLVALVQRRTPKYHLQPFDFIQLTNFIQASAGLKTAETWTPVCLPKFNPTGFLHAYLVFISKEVCLVLITSSTSHESLMQLTSGKEEIVAGLSKADLPREIESAAHSVVPSAELSGIVGLLHFVMRWAPPQNQLSEASYPPMFAVHKERKRLLRRYQHMYTRLISTDMPVRHAVEVTDLVMIVGLCGSDGILMATFERLTKVEDAMASMDVLLRNLKRNRDELLLTAGVW